MKKFFIYTLTALAALTIVSCNDDDVTFKGATDLDRMPMTMFRRAANTGIAESSDTYCSAVDPEIPNKIHVFWYGIKDCAGYEMRIWPGMQFQEDLAKWNEGVQNGIIETILFAPDQTDLILKNLRYDTQYLFAIRVLSHEGASVDQNGNVIITDPNCPKHSNWYGIGGGQEWDDYCTIKTNNRYPTPDVIYPCENRTKTSFTVMFNLKYSEAGDNEANHFTDNFDVNADGNFTVDHMRIKLDPEYVGKVEDVPLKWQNYELTDDDKKNGFINIDGLVPNTAYTIDFINDSKIFTDERTGLPCEIDAEYNQMSVRTKGDPAPDRYLAWSEYFNPNDTIPGAIEYQACRIDDILLAYNTDSEVAEGQVFQLDGDRSYYFATAFDITKGFTLETKPEDLAAGKRAKVYLGGLSRDESGDTRAVNFNFGRPKVAGEGDAPILVENIIFRGIDFDCPLAENYGERTVSGKGGDGTGNYFVNMNSQGKAVTLESIEWYDCTFQRMIRGFIRTQGSKQKIFKKVIMKDCIHYNSGYYGKDARGYSWFDVDKNNDKTNAFVDAQFYNNTFYCSPRDHFFDNSDSELAWSESLKYKITMENNTFINFSTQKSGRYLFNLRFVPGGSEFIIKKNLFVLAAADDDNRGLTNTACDIRKICGSGELTMDIEDNYSVGCRDAHLKDDGIWSSRAFSATSNSFGAYLKATPGLLSGDQETLKTKVGTPALKATDLFVNPNPPYHATGDSDYTSDRYAAPSNIFEALKYQKTDLVLNHEIWTKNIGDPRWRN